jgi:hypothetical protein
MVPSVHREARLRLPIQGDELYLMQKGSASTDASRVYREAVRE